MRIIPEFADLGIVAGLEQAQFLLQTLDRLHVDDAAAADVALVAVESTEQVAEPLVESHHRLLLRRRRVEQHPERVRVRVLAVIPDAATATAKQKGWR